MSALILICLFVLLYVYFFFSIQKTSKITQIQLGEPSIFLLHIKACEFICVFDATTFTAAFNPKISIILLSLLIVLVVYAKTFRSPS